MQMMTDYDILTFFPKDSTTIEVNSMKYKKDLQLNTQNHNAWHILTFKLGDESVDCSEAILLDPREYVSNLIDSKIFGFVARKTDQSNDYITTHMVKFMNNFLTAINAFKK